MPLSVRPGDVLADRYRLVDLLVESGSGRFWRAHDRVLERHVALHVLEADDERAPRLLEAARQSATVPDRHLLRVLDADQVDGLCYVVNEWGSGSSLDIMLATDGPLAARRAAWLVSEVASSVASGHDAGVAHGRLVPENVLVDASGSIRVIGFSVDAALHGLPAGRTSGDVVDLGALLYCALTGRWPGVSHSEVPPAPHEHGRVLRPRQVRAGIPRPLDALCDQVLNPYSGPASRDGHDLTTARGIADYLRDFVGDPTGLAEAEAASRGSSNRTVVLPALPTAATGTLPRPADPPAARRGEPDRAQRPAAQPPTPDPTPDPAAAATDETPRTGPAEQPTQAGLPIFDDENDDVSWLTARSTPPPPPPPFEEPPERPLFAPEPTDGQPVRKPRPHAASTTPPPDYWPWDTGTGTGTGSTPVPEEDEDEEVPGRSWLRLAALIGLSLVLLLAVVVVFNLGRGRSPLGAKPEEDSPAPSPSASASPTPLTGVTASDFDPQGDPPEENPDLAPLAVDGDPTTAWRTMTYNEDLGPGGLKTGVGLTLDLGSVHDVASVDLTLVGGTTGVSVYLTGKAPTTVSGLTAAADADVTRARQRVAIDEPVRARFVTIWLTSLPEVDGGFRGEVAEVTVRG
ncbi:protein kinase family protein [Nocardioides sp. MAHUQ-72]|uniref:protein kinase family protein n=1 Tax=unclassified Nocardioides TaxID=2615069 RepID=UPI0036171AAD